jgi:plasmid stabilization system protein ParE
LKPFHFHPAADIEIDAAYAWYLEESLQAAKGFSEELYPAVNRVQAMPQLYPRYLYGTQRLVLHKYPFSVVFRELQDEIQIIAVAHAKRRPGYWQKRL